MPDAGRGQRGMGRRYDPLRQLVATRFKEVIREPEAIFWSFVFPVLLAVGLGIAFRSRPAEVSRVGVVQVGGDARADSLIVALRASPAVQPVVMRSEAEGQHALRTARVALLVVPTTAGVEYRYDDTRPDARAARLLADDAVQRGAGRRDAVTIGERHVRERGARYIDFLIPGLLGMNIMAGGMWSVGFSIADARRKHLLKRLVASPMPRAYYLLSYVVTRLAFLGMEVGCLLVAGVLLFGVPVRGAWMQLGVVAVLASLTFSGLGLLVASRARTIEGVSGLMNVAMMPMWVLSGIFFSAANFPEAVQPFIQALPLTAAIDALRATMLQGQGWGAIAHELVIMGAWMATSFGVALGIFRWR